jgi:hypothetical protein
MKTRQAEDQHLDYDTNKSVNIRYNEFLNEHELQSRFNFSRVEVDFRFRPEWFMLLSAFLLKIAARDAINS